MIKTIRVVVIIHQDLKNYRTDDLYKDYFSWAEKELELISGRNVLIDMRHADELPSLSAYEYKHTDETVSIKGWMELVRNFHWSIAQWDSTDETLTKIVLLTRSNINSRFGGMTTQKGYCAIASIQSYQIPAHEIGHMLGATHEDSEVVYDGWWHDTIMSADSLSELRGNKYQFTEKNRQNIRNYLDRL